MSTKKINKIEKKWQEVFKTIAGAKTDIQNHVILEREVIPIIFVPGIMGSRLSRSDGSRAWDPDSSGFMLWDYGMPSTTAKKKRKLLIGPNNFNPGFLQVIENDSKQVKKFFKSYPNAVEHGWTGVFWSAYGTIIKSLHHNRLWPELVGLCFDFPVHALGYNWSASAEEAGAKLAAKIEEIITKYKSGEYSPDKKKRMCERVIIVSHSMGGLVARSACKQLGGKAVKKVLGVIHGVQPAMGSPAAYWRIKAGFERPQGGPNKSAWYNWKTHTKKMLAYKGENTIGACILGTDGKEVTALLGNMPGGLQLLPNKHYTDNKGNKSWLHYPLKDGSIITLPKNDPYSEIYSLQNVPHRMVNPDWLDPGRIKKNKNKENKSINPITSPWGKYLGYLSEAENFHDELGLYVHPNTCQFYSSKLASPDKIVYTRCSVVRQEYNSSLHRTVIVTSGTNFTPNNKGSFQTYVDRNEQELLTAAGATYIITLERPNGDGDGTVPDSSAKALPVAKGQTVKIVFENESEWFETGHQGIYNTKKAENIVKNAIGNLAIKRIEQEIGKAKADAIRDMYRKQVDAENTPTGG